MKVSRSRKLTFNLGGFENYVVEASIEETLDGPTIDPEVVGGLMDKVLDTLLLDELRLVESLSGNKESAIFEHPAIKR